MSTPLFSRRMSIVIDGSTLLCPTDFGFSANKDIIEVACLSSSGAKRALPDMYGWTISFSGIVQQTDSKEAGDFGIEELMAKFVTDASVGIYILPDVSLNTYYSGSGYLSTINWGGAVGAAVTYDGEVTMDGTWTVNTTA